MRLTSLLFAAFCLAPLAHAAEVYKCTDARGDVAFQDRPCAVGTHQAQVHIVPAPPYSPSPTVATAPATASQSAQAPPTVLPPRVALPPLWICQNAEDGTQYFSHNGSPPVKYVPLGTLGYPGQSLSQAYGPGGIGVSAPGMRQIPIDHSPDAALAAGYTPLQDRCVRASRDQTCNYLSIQYDKIRQKLRRAFKDQQAVLQPQADALAAQLDGC